MKKNNLLFLLLILSSVAILTESCKKEDRCPVTNCNTGTLNEATCLCNCPSGYIGTNCENFDFAQVQTLLDEGRTPQELVIGNVSIDSLYGKLYEGGLIFYYNETDGSGMVAAIEDQGTEASWGCFGTNILELNDVEDCPGITHRLNGFCRQPVLEEIEEGARIGDGATNTDLILTSCEVDGIAAKLCRNLGDEWFLPSRGELNLMYHNLHLNGHGNFSTSTFYWSSTEFFDFSTWGLDFNDGLQGETSKIFKSGFRAARTF